MSLRKGISPFLNSSKNSINMNEIGQLYVGIHFADYKAGQISHILWGMTEASLGGAGFTCPFF
jgi:hypothetical protein